MRILVSTLLALATTPTLAADPARRPGMLAPLVPVATASAPVLLTPSVVYRPIVSDSVFFRPVISPVARYWYPTPKPAEPVTIHPPMRASACPVRGRPAGTCPAR